MSTTDASKPASGSGQNVKNCNNDQLLVAGTGHERSGDQSPDHDKRCGIVFVEDGDEQLRKETPFQKGEDARESVATNDAPVYRRARGTYHNKVVVRLSARRMKWNGRGGTEDGVITRSTRRCGEACTSLGCDQVPRAALRSCVVSCPHIIRIQSVSDLHRQGFLLVDA
ncbi:uncharacterized protein BJ212DRAFT_1301123 [Suillus subaureus]|uniref:Uncharacterized protein n=1 Tax=Suillus subaureus TaxID=48587 RepID=A0A9P7JBS9_9AGAM|nr:uncharacterized protein BJ212DRAFT_1301123 [Suillus subaureus]KAG1813205.1 hypothetical protein BJ212DRAFT_1301123 [Suillus subaureus]